MSARFRSLDWNWIYIVYVKLFLWRCWVKNLLTILYSPQQNEVSERKNRKIMEMSIWLLHEKNLPKKFWAEEANTIVFLLNRLSTWVVKWNTPFKAWYGVKPILKNLEIFECLCFCYVPRFRRDKIDKKQV